MKSTEELAAALTHKARILAMDVGEKTIGIALSDELRTVATPHSIIERTKWGKDAALIRELLNQFSVCAILVGYPINMDGSLGPRCQSTRQFVRSLEQLTDIPIMLWDERLSTIAAHRSMLEADLSRQRRKELVDKIAASYLLQGALDQLAMQAR